MRGLLVVAVVLCLVAPSVVRADGQYGAVIRIERSAFQPDAGNVTFSEKRLGTRNPVYEARDYGGKEGLTLSFGGFFRGQSIGRTQCGRGAAPGGCVVGRPEAPLALDPRAPITSIEADGANPRSPSLSGTPKFNGPVTILFSRDVAGVGLAGGYFNARGGTSIRAYDASGNEIGGVINQQFGMEYMALVTEDGVDRIRGLQFSLVGPEPAGFAIDDLSFAFATQIRRDQVLGLKEVLGADAAARPTQATPKPSLRSVFEKADPSVEAAPDPAATPEMKPGAGSLSCLFDTADCTE